MIVKITINCKDTGFYSLHDNAKKQIGNETQDYIPDFIPNDYGDVLKLEVDLETGRILNWKSPNVKKVVKWFNEVWPYERDKINDNLK